MSEVRPVADFLEQEGGASVLKAWPRKAKEQALCSLWLAHAMFPGRPYHEEEIDWLIATRFTRAKVPDCPTVRKELERCGLVEREPGGGAFRLDEPRRAAALAKPPPPPPPASHGEV